MKYKTLVMKQIDKHTYQYSMNAPLDHLSPILSFDEEILEVNFGGSLTLAHSQYSQMSFMYGFFFAKFLFFTVVCVVIVI